MKKHEPALYDRIVKICDVHTYVVWKLTGMFKTSWASADPLDLLDLKRKSWSPTILKALELKENQLPNVYCPGSVLGKISIDASCLTGLSKDTLVIAGGGDGQSAGLGAGVLDADHAYLNLGTAVVAGVYGEKYVASKAFRTMSSCSESGYYYECSLRAGTFSIDWFIKIILDTNKLEQSKVYNQLEKEAEAISVGSNGLWYLPYLCGVMNPYWDVNARGAFVGLSSFHTRAHIYRAILEGIAFEQLLAINAVETELNRKVKDFIAIGGGAKSSLWCRIISDVTGKNVCIPVSMEASALGAGISASIGIGWYATFKEAVRRMTKIEKTIAPDIKANKQYQKLFNTYKEIYPALKQFGNRQ